MEETGGGERKKGGLEEGGRWAKAGRGLEQDRRGRERKGGGGWRMSEGRRRRVEEDRGECRKVQEGGAF